MVPEKGSAMGHAKVLQMEIYLGLQKNALERMKAQEMATQKAPAMVQGKAKLWGRQKESKKVEKMGRTRELTMEGRLVRQWECQKHDVLE